MTAEHHRLFDVPSEIKEDLTEAGFHVYKQKKSPVTNLQAQKGEQLLQRISLIEQRLKRLEEQKKKPINMIGAGSLTNNLLQNQETKEYANGDKYVGTLVNGKREG